MHNENYTPALGRQLTYGSKFNVQKFGIGIRAQRPLPRSWRTLIFERGTLNRPQRASDHFDRKLIVGEYELCGLFVDDGFQDHVVLP